MTHESSAVIAVTRLPDVTGIDTRMTVFIDDRRVGELSYLEREKFMTSPGKHSVSVKMEWRRSEKKIIEAPADGVVELQCGQSHHGIKALLYYFTKPRQFFRIQSAPPLDDSRGATPRAESEAIHDLPFEKVTSMYESDPLFEENAARALTDAFGHHACGVLMQEEVNQIDIYGSDLCLALLKSREAEHNPDLSFILYSKLAKFALKETHYQKATHFYKKALELFPDNPLVNFRIAEVYECVGAGEDAIRHYQAALNAPTTGERVKSCISSQIHIVETGGPRKANQMAGLRYISY